MKILYGIVGFILGAAIGGAAAYIYTERKLSAEFEADLEDYKVRSSKSSENDTPAEAPTHITKTTKGENDDMKNVPNEAVEAARRMQEGIRKAVSARNNTSKTNYNNVDDIPQRKTESQLRAEGRPVLIDYDEWASLDGDEAYVHADFTYNREYDILYDDGGNPMEDIDTWIGYNNLDKLRELGTSEIYIRNEYLKAIVSVEVDEDMG